MKKRCVFFWDAVVKEGNKKTTYEDQQHVTSLLTETSSYGKTTNSKTLGRGRNVQTVNIQYP